MESAEKPKEDKGIDPNFPKPEPFYTPCGGCGAEEPKDRCLGCRHDFGRGHDGYRNK